MNNKTCAINLLLLAVLLLTSGTVLAQSASVKPAKQYSVSQGVIPAASEFFQGSSDRELDLLTGEPNPQRYHIIATNPTMIDLAPFVTQANSAPGQPPQTQPPTQTQPPNPTEETPGSLTGTVVSASRQTMVVRTEDNQYHLFVFDTDLVRPKGLTPGAHVRVRSNSMDESGVRVATSVSVLESGAPPDVAPPDVAPPPKEMLEVQREIEKEVRKWQLGVRVGAGLDPEIFLIGVHTAIGPIFSRDFYLRPNVEFGFGELTDMFAINLEGAYRLPINFRHGRWSSYLGAGPSLNFVHQGLERREVDFGNFEFESGLNIFSGVRFRRGTFAEVKANIWAHSVPTLRLILGYTF
jgi:hypothetical protein